MLVVAYIFNDSLVDKVDQHGGGAGSCPGITLLTLFIAFTGGNIVWTVYQYILFGGCSSNVALMSITSVCGVAMYGLNFLRTRRDASLFTSSLVLCYCLFLQWSALTSQDPESGCKNEVNEVTNTIVEIVIGLIFTWVALLTIAAVTKKDEETSVASTLNSPILEKEEDSGEKVEDVQVGDQVVTAEDAHVYPVT